MSVEHGFIRELSLDDDVAFVDKSTGTQSVLHTLTAWIEFEMKGIVESMKSFLLFPLGFVRNSKR